MSAIRRVLTVVLCSFALFGCQEDGLSVSESETDVPDILALEQRACEKDGGNWALAPSKVGFTCYRQTRDASEPCAKDTDCQGLCLARSRTCAPITPFFGCHEILSASGTRQTLCIE